MAVCNVVCCILADVVTGLCVNIFTFITLFTLYIQFHTPIFNIFAYAHIYSPKQPPSPNTFGKKHLLANKRIGVVIKEKKKKLQKLRGRGT